MKKGVNIIAIIGIVLVLIIVGVVLAFFLREPASAGGMGSDDSVEGIGYLDLGYSALHLENIDQFTAYAEERAYECHLGDDRSGGSIYGVPVTGSDAIVTYYFDAQGKTTDFEAFFYLNADVLSFEEIVAEELTQEELADACLGTVVLFCQMFDCSFESEVYLTNEDGTFTLIEENTDFKNFSDGLSYLTFSIRDESGYYWELTLYTSEGLVTANVRKYFNREETADYLANISLFEEE